MHETTRGAWEGEARIQVPALDESHFSQKTEKHFLSYFAYKFIYVKEVSSCPEAKAKTGFRR